MIGRFRRQPGDPGGPPDLSALPPVPVGHPLGLAAVPPDLLSAYLRHPVTGIGWTVRFADGTSAAVDVQPHGGPSLFEHLRAGFRRQPAGAEFGVAPVAGAPYETYREGDVVAARGRAHDVAVRAAGLRSGHAGAVLAGLAAVTLRALGS
ncbi:hypothetical protein KZZ52_39850 [Dactylosporangium sp. AC04546]|uniref:hypothetical protein n=1 Tax=Dactylosporangium sp. AC04546 TaxID=2862460 RepID=UPI001EDF632B|nr:hypothetical protein [Dactylosporangium sp. AC04546]WVK80104.1 hypothetical protein KZZ52_39850 [Dactylosporangium sp. AC04546]